MATPKLKLILISAIIVVLVYYEPLAAFNGNGHDKIDDFYGRMNNYLASRSLSAESPDGQALARLERTRFVNSNFRRDVNKRTRFVNRNFRRNINKQPRFNQRLQKRLNKKFRDVRAHKSQSSGGRRIRSNKIARRKSMLTDGRRAFQDSLRYRLQRRPRSDFRRELRDAFHRQTNGPQVRRSDAHRHR